MINLFYINVEPENLVDGINSYKKNIIPYLENNKVITLHHVIFSDRYTTPKVEESLLIKTYKLPIARFSKLLFDDLDLKSIAFFTNEIKHCENIVFHFNWINHVTIAQHLKKLINCTTILTKHCLPWRDLVTNQYASFYKINDALGKGISLKVTDPKIQKEIVGYDSIDHIITVTECAKKSLTQLFKIDGSKITKVSNGLAPEEIKPNFKGDKNKLRKKYGFGTDEKLIIYAGNVNPRKGIFDIISCITPLFKKHAKLKIIIAGPGNYDGIQKLAKNNWSKVVCCGSLDKQTLYNFYAMADIGIVPSYIEQCSYTAIEMMHSNLPIIVSDVDGLKEMVNNDCGLRIKVDFKKAGVSLNPRDLKEKINFYLLNPNKAKRFAQNAKKYAMQHFTAERMAIETIAVYEKVLISAHGVGINNLIKGSYDGADNKKPLVSVIIPCYNAEKYLQECLDSIARQSISNFEIILINDGSTDGTAQLIKQQSDRRIVYLENEKNKGVAYSLNKAIKKAQGTYIARMDADDTMHTDRLKKQVDFLENNLDYGLVGSWHNATEINGTPLQRIETPEDHAEICLTMLFHNPISHPTVMVRRALVLANPYHVGYPRCEDYELWFRLARQTKLKNLPLALLNYRSHSENTVVQHQKEMQQSVMKLWSKQLTAAGILHNIEELVLHCAIGFGLGKKFFNTPVRITSLHSWLDKVFEHKQLKNKYKKNQVSGIRAYILRNCCGFY